MPDELEQTLFLHHSNVIARIGVQMTPLTRNLRLVDSKSINYMLMAQRNL
jgi:2-polyprenyl-3-methyl-5-hydroxy-6-metoxy-1,4-benzoquinol methylase